VTGSRGYVCSDGPLAGTVLMLGKTAEPGPCGAHMVAGHREPLAGHSMTGSPRALHPVQVPERPERRDVVTARSLPTSA
jgi:hypothetical protein